MKAVLPVRVVRKFVSQPREALLLCRMAWWVVVLSIAARVYSLPRALQIVAGSETKTKRPQDAHVQDQLACSIDRLLAADFFLFKPICWKRAAVLHRYLLRNGIATRIVFGVRNESNGQVAGHAWLEAEGEPILESSPPQYVVTYQFPSNQKFNSQVLPLTNN
jgi:transglutaminase superfamily protein